MSLETLKKKKIMLSKVLKKKKEIYKKLHDYLLICYFKNILQMLQQRMKNISGTPVISNSGIATEKISAYLKTAKFKLGVAIKRPGLFFFSISWRKREFPTFTSW